MSLLRAAHSKSADNLFAQQAIVSSLPDMLHPFVVSVAARLRRAIEEPLQQIIPQSEEGAWDFAMRDDGSMDFVRRKKHNKFNEQIANVLNESVAPLLKRVAKKGHYDFRGAVEAAGGRIEIGELKMWIEPDGILVIIHPAFKGINHAGRDEFAVYAKDEAKSRHEISELRQSAIYALEHGLATPQEILKGHLGSIYRAYLNTHAGDIGDKKNEQRRQAFKPMIQRFHDFGVAAEAQPSAMTPPVAALVELLATQTSSSKNFRHPAHTKRFKKGIDWITRRSSNDTDEEPQTPWIRLDELAGWIKNNLMSSPVSEMSGLRAEYPTWMATSQHLEDRIRLAEAEGSLFPARLDTVVDHQGVHRAQAAVELISNSLDAMAKSQLTVGRFGVGFYQVLQWLKTPEDRVVVTTHARGSAPYRLSYRFQNGRYEVQIARLTDEAIRFGTTTEVRPATPLSDADQEILVTFM